MFKIITNCFLWLFQEKQLFVRQNGAVKFVTFSSFLQFLLFLTIGGAIAWTAFTSNQFFTLHQTVVEKDQAIAQVKAELAALNQAYAEKQETLQTQLAKLNQQQTLVHDLIESMPGTIEPDTTLKQVLSSELDQSDIPLENQTETAFTEHLPEDDSQFVPEVPQELDSKTPPVQTPAVKSESEQSKPATSQIKSVHLLQVMDEQQNQLAAVDLNLENNFTTLLNKVLQRKNTLQAAIDNSGINLALALPQASQAQGGPLYQVSQAPLSDTQQLLVENLITLKELEEAISLLPNQLPAKDFYISSSYGVRKDPMTGKAAMHKGIDMAGWKNTKIFSPANGIVKRAGNNGGYGRFIEIEHENGFVTRFGHLAKIKVKTGQKIEKDELIGLMGSTGRSTSTHLHYEVLHNNKHVNPLKLAKAFAHVL
ncbi:M23 family metallopeptidase [Pseudoalteromonas tunicata]|uniref:Putative peptidase family M23/M37 protein n=1 Tax=Pseudoalteromonas tunicata D2 TaxID=87626 RepID=A4C670_9GAMM|nr:M23 family metallopeptidase [Pseudoalteromonas tunicata]ATC95447.1 hypothetical protein PTUN_a3058 [Pseudoalteromonas tunicata]AXT31024.1 M23 family peptidase [Pseudoalteromonas tunicata]EAR29474.1 putative peptidase family M23/M37 protein [Pseudoalteromonas tunicata D2]MDP4985699.1 M23 family metallopeptidase [Pseudoalteromonas tunicata]